MNLKTLHMQCLGVIVFNDLRGDEGILRLLRNFSARSNSIITHCIGVELHVSCILLYTLLFLTMVNFNKGTYLKLKLPTQYA